ncbi:16S rRNA (guanine(527)-N(7))-methyltransferase [hydrothermal vent metagenome]|uniref:16S rRNA (Guanine(527)-N(7))-methyltransferase n=1 Tax=hydrothermal vent metagenome TaxID=652676 RepID=A0A3B1CAU7_9ZZZZ
MSRLNQLLEVFRDERLQLPSAGDAEAWGTALEVYLDEWQKWNGKINLTSETDAAAVIKKHIFDSLQYVRAVENPKSRVMDIGSGAGFPGIPLKVVFPELSLTLVDSQRKRTNFLRNCARKMALDNVEVLTSRAEVLGDEYNEQFDLVLFRGVGEVAQCLELAMPYLKTGGQVAFKKGLEAHASHEVSEADHFMALQDEIPIVGQSGIASKMMLFAKCFT